MRRLTALPVYCFLAASVHSYAAAVLPDAVVPPEAELIVLLDTTSPQKLAATVDDALRSVTTSTKTTEQQALYAALGSPLKARYVIAERLTAEQLKRFEPDSPRILLDQFVLLSYRDAAAADASRRTLTANKGIVSVTQNTRYSLSTTPSDPGFQAGSYGTGFMNYQWGLQQMNFPAAWDTVKGNAYVAVLDTGIQLGHPDLTANFKPQLSKILSGTATLDDEIGVTGSFYAKGHGTHVAGTIAANTNNSLGVAGGCWNCALLIGKLSSPTDGLGPPDLSRVAAGITYAVDAGAQLANMSFGADASRTCIPGSSDLLCAAIQYAVNRNVVMVAAAGNKAVTTIGDVQEPANQSAIIPVGALQPTRGARGRLWTETRISPIDPFFSGSSTGPSMQNRGVVAAGMDVFSTVYTGLDYIEGFCGDFVGGSPLDGFGPCTGTSMATPHISALVGLMRSVNPWVNSNLVGVYLRAAGDNANTLNEQEGFGQPNAATAVQSMVATNPGRLIPLLSMYSSSAENYFYTTVPQMAMAAYFGTLKPSVAASTYAFVGTAPSGFDYIPDGPFYGIPTGAQVWVIGTYQNPVAPGEPLLPLIRMSYKCGDQVPTPNPACDSNPNHVDHLLSTNVNSEVAAYIAVGYKIDGVEGYVYDAAYAQRAGTEPLLRAYNPARDDHAVFPLREQGNMAAQGYTLDVINLGYAYPVTNAPAPPL